MGKAVLFLVGLVLITFGADWLVTGSSRVAARLRISPLVVGLTVVAFGTSAPELFVSSLAALRGQAGLAVGTVMGSTVANVGLIAGLGALIRPIDVKRRLLIRESPFLVLVLLIVMLLSWNDALGRLDGLALMSGFLIYLVFMLLSSKALTGQHLDALKCISRFHREEKYCKFLRQAKNKKEIRDLFREVDEELNGL